MAPSIVPGEEELGPQRRCPRCGCWWPEDEEFFLWTRIKGRPGWHSWCRACLAEAAVLRRARQGSTPRALSLTLAVA